MSLTCSPCFTVITPGSYSYFFAVILISFTPFPACVPAPASCVKAARGGKCESITAVTTKTATALLRSDRFISSFDPPMFPRRGLWRPYFGALCRRRATTVRKGWASSVLRHRLGFRPDGRLVQPPERRG